MRIVIQRVSEASVTINSIVHASIGKGFLILVGIEDADNEEDAEWLTTKVAGLRIFDDENGVMNRSIVDIDGEALIISQFTLHALTRKGNRPSYIKAAGHEKAIPLYELFCKKVSDKITRDVKKGIFAADMKVALVNDGPVTILIDSKNKE
ncbi:MAG: D-aminoacyl-tRNA deacylase [Paludibacter sp.]